MLRWQHPDGYPDHEFIVGDAYVLLGEIDGYPHYIDRRLDEAWHQDQFVLDVEAGEAEGFSLPAGKGLHFVTRSPARALPAKPTTVHIGATALLAVSVASYGVPVPGQPASTGPGIFAVTAGTPAAAAGLAPGGVIVSLGGHAVTSAAGLRSAIDAYHAGNKTSVVWAGLAGQTYTATVVFAAGPVG